MKEDKKENVSVRERLRQKIDRGKNGERQTGKIRNFPRKVYERHTVKIPYTIGTKEIFGTGVMCTGWLASCNAMPYHQSATHDAQSST